MLKVNSITCPKHANAEIFLSFDVSPMILTDCYPKDLFVDRLMSLGDTEAR